MDERHLRTAALLGEETMERLARAHVLVVGAGGVGGWCAEALARSGVGNLTIVDDDTVAPSNLNRQCAATVATLGRVKVEAMAERLAAVNPDCRVTALCVRYPDASICLSDFDVVVDAIDSVDCKAELILNATEAGVPLVSSMGAALRLDPTRVRVSRFDKVAGDGLARALRQRFKRLERYPKNFTAVWSDETPTTNSPRGSAMPVVATFGMCMAMEVIKYVRSIDCILFDLDGTLTDSAPGILNSIRYALEKMGRPIPDAATLNKFLGPPLMDSFQRHCGMTVAESAEALSAYREYFTAKGLFENSVYAGVVPMLERLKAAGCKIVLATSKPEAFARRILDHFDLTRWFDAIHGATLDEKRNHKKDVIAWALAHSGEIGRAVMVGDRANDIEGARANGIDAIGVLWGYGDEAELREAGATRFAATPKDIEVACHFRS